MRAFDAHCHLPDVDIPNDVGAIVNATQPHEWARVINMANRHINIYGAIGVHPWYASGLQSNWDFVLCDLLAQNPDIMVGEIGLDKYKPDLDLQNKIFIRQLDIAHEMGRGVHVHCVGVWDKMLAILKSHKKTLPPFILFHRFNGNPNDIKKLVAEYNAYFSYRDATVEQVVMTPADRILIETDSNTPTDITMIEKNIAKICNGCNFCDNTMRMLKQ